MEAWEATRPVLDEYLEENGEFMLAGMNYSEMRDYIPTLFSGILDGSKRIRQIVEDLKNFLRKDHLDLNQPIDMNIVLRSAVSLLSNMIQKSTSRFSLDYGPDLPVLKGNFQRLEQVVINLIQNACQALTDPRQAISVATSSDEERVFVIVQDEGAGIPRENLSRIFDPFFTTHQDSGGTGLGLAISSRIVDEHGGTIVFTSQVGRGTRVELTLPAVRPASNPMEK
jgi:signal transduction histidine kinase